MTQCQFLSNNNQDNKQSLTSNAFSGKLGLSAASKLLSGHTTGHKGHDIRAEHAGVHARFSRSGNKIGSNGIVSACQWVPVP